MNLLKKNTALNLIATVITLAIISSMVNAQTIKSSTSWPKVDVSKKTYNFDTTDTYDDFYYQADQTEVKKKKITPVYRKLKRVVKEASTTVVKVPKKQRLKKRTTKKTTRKFVKSNKNSSKLQTVQKKTSSFNLSPFAGAAFFTVSGNLLQNTFQNGVEHELGYAAGALFEYRKPNAMLGFETGAYFVQTGAKGDERIVNSAKTFSLSFLLNEYVVAPLALKFYPLAKKGYNVYIKAGASAGFLTSSTVEQFSLGTLSNQLNTTNSFKNFDLQGLAGIGARFSIMKNVAVNLEATYNRSLLNISDLNISGIDAFNDGFIASLGINISL